MPVGPGTMVTPSVRLVEPLARGGMGLVWVAEHLGLESRVAVKFVDPDRLAKDPTLATRFRREANVAARLSSPHVVRIFDHGRMDDGTAYMVMELLRGETLGKLLQREQRLSIAKTTSIVSQVAGVLEGAHCAGIVHRDIKPENLFLLDAEYDVFVKLLDFGVAKVDGALEGVRAGSAAEPLDEAGLTRTGAMLGTPWYMAPEQLVDSRDVDHRADLWALAVVAYHAITGRRPFAGRSVSELAAAIHDGELTPASRLVDGVPSALDAWFGRALSVTPEHRFASALEQARAFAAALEPFAGRARTPEPRAEDTPTEDGGERSRGIAPISIDRATQPLSTTTAAPPRRRIGWSALALVSVAAVAGAVALSPRKDPAPADGDVRAGDRLPATTTSAAETPSIPPSAPPTAAMEPAVDPSSPASAAEAPPARRPPTVPSAATKATPAAATAAPSASAKPGARARPEYCDTDGAYVVDERGHLRPKPECL